MKRLSQQAHERIDRNKVLTFQWQGKSYQGYAGDTLASALLANGVAVVGRSFKYGRYRGILAAGAEEPNALMTLEQGGYTVPNARATEVELYAGLKAEAASGRPSLEQDVRAWLKPLHRFMPAGFYYKTFKAPWAWWPWYEKQLRHLTGFSAVPSVADVEHYDHQYQHVDIAVVGAGVAGMAAALQAAEAGASVLLLDERVALGGEIASELGRGEEANAAFQQLKSALQNQAKVQILTRTTAFALHDFNLLLAMERLQDHLPLAERQTNAPRQRQHKIRAKQVILATGSHERPLMFAENDLPGIVLAGAMRRYLHEYAVLGGDHVVIAGNNNSIYDLAHDLVALGQLPIVVDMRIGYAPEDLLKQGITIWQGYAPLAAQGTQRVSSISIAKVTWNSKGNGWDTGSEVHQLTCDAVAMSGGFSPLVHLDCHTGSKPIFSDSYQAFMPACDKPDRYVAGSLNGLHSWQACLQDGQYAAQQAVNALGLSVTPITEPTPESLGVTLFYCPPTQREKVFIDLQNDVKASDIELALRENYRSIEHIKRYTALGFGTDQGKTSNVNGIALAAEVLGVGLGEVGTTTFRPMYTPVTMGALAGEAVGELFEPRRYTPMHPSHLAAQVPFENVGQWLRPHYFPQAGETMQQAVERECLAVRQGVGIFDASTLGKIDIQGPDARELLNRVYTNAWGKLAVGMCRYGLMLDESGMIIDDGVTACIGENHFLMTTTTGGAARIFSHLERWHQTEWSDLKVYFTSVTDHWATTALVGPKARKLIQKVCSDIDFSPSAFPFMAWRAGTVCGVPARVMRISFSGELAYEINVQANYARYIWDQLLEVGKEFNITPYGTESMHVLRAEKGYLIVGQDTDGSITPYDANMAWIVAKNKSYAFLGERSLSRSDTVRPDRKQLVGLYTVDPNKVLPEGSQLVNSEADNNMLGHVTSSYCSPILGRSIALAVMKNGLGCMGATLYVKVRTGEAIPVIVVDSVFYDKDKEKLDGEV